MRRRCPHAPPLLLLAVATLSIACNGGPPHFTGFVEGEERVIRSEVTGRVLDVVFGEGEQIPADAVVARLDDRDVAARIESKRREIAVLEADVATQTERVTLVERTWQRDRDAAHAEVRRAEAAARLAESTWRRERELAATGASTAQLLDDARAARDQAASGLEQARQMLARREAQERTIALARGELQTLHERVGLARAQLAELEVTRAKSTIRAPAVPTVVQSQLTWPGELAQPGTPILSVLDPTDKYVQIFVPVDELAQVRLGRSVEIELDSEPGHRVPGEVSFIADEASFTPSKIETRGDRLGQVYRAKIRILEEVERFRPGTEGNVYLVDDAGQPPR